MPEASLQNETVRDSALVLFHAGKVSAAEKAAQSEQGKLRSEYAQVKLSGLDLDAFKAARKLAKGSPDKVIAKVKSLARTVEYATVLNRDAVKQVSFEEYLADLDAPASQDGVIYEEGRYAALIGTATQPPAGYNETQVGHWGEGWREGEAERKRIEEMAANYTAAQKAEASDEIEDEDLDDQDLDDDEAEEEPEAATDAVTAEPATNVVEFAAEVEDEASPKEDMPDIPPALDRRRSRAAKGATNTGSGFDAQDAS